MGWIAISTPGDLCHPGIVPASLASSALADRFFSTVPLGKPEAAKAPFSIQYGICVYVLVSQSNVLAMYNSLNSVTDTEDIFAFPN